MSQRSSCALLGIVDTDTLQVEFEGQPRLIRLMDVAPESAKPGGAEPPTEFGRRTLEFLRQTVFNNVNRVELQIPSANMPVSDTNKLLAHVFIGGDNLNIRLVRDGWSPCFVKYGFPLLHRAELEQAELWARHDGRGIWGNANGRDYEAIKRYWLLRAGQIDGHRHASAMGEDIFDVRLDYYEIVSRAKAGGRAVIFGDLSRAFALNDGALLIQSGSPLRPFCAWIPPKCRGLGQFLERSFVGFGKPNYVYLSGHVTVAGDQPQMVIESLEQVTTHPPRAE